MKFYIFKEFDGCPVRDFLKIRKGFSSRLFLLVKESIYINGKKASPHNLCREGDVVEVMFPEKESSVLAEYAPLDILYEDDFFVAVNKPSFMPCHPSIGHREGTLANYIKGYFEKGQGCSSIHIPSRLDMNTSGVVLIAKNEYAAGKLAKLFKAGAVNKEYICVCKGKLKPDGEISASIARKEGSIIERCISEKGKEAVTFYKTIKWGEGYSVAKVSPKTGRTHQIRLHFSYIGHPLLGDWLYGKEDETIGRHLLHLKRLEFMHPEYKINIIIEAPIPGELSKYMG